MLVDTDPRAAPIGLSCNIERSRDSYERQINIIFLNVYIILKLWYDTFINLICIIMYYLLLLCI